MDTAVHKTPRPSWKVRSGALTLVLLLHGGLLLVALRSEIDLAADQERVVHVVEVPLDRPEPPPIRFVELSLIAPPPPQVPAPELAIEEAPTAIQSDLTPLETTIQAVTKAGDGSALTQHGGGGSGDAQGSGASVYTKCTNRVMPFYPNDAKNRGETGRVTLLVELDERGKFTRIAVARSSGSRALDAAGIDALKRWRCSPVIENGRPVRVIAKQEFDFSLRKN